MTAIGFELRFTRTTRTDTAAESGHLRTVTDETRRSVFELCKLNLQLSFPRDGVKRLFSGVSRKR